MLVLAHRGSSAQAPENTMAAFELALEVGAHGLELDVYLSKDEEIVVIHDPTLERTTNGSGPVEQHTLEELKRLDAGSWFSPEFQGESIPTLRQVCELVKEQDLWLNIETKAALGFEGLNYRLVELLGEFNLKDKVIVSSFNHFALAHLKQIQAPFRTGILYTAALVDPWVYAQSIGAEALHPYYLTVIPQIAAGARQNGMLINPWTVNRLEDMQRLKDAGVDSIITDLPHLALDLI